MNEAGIPRRIGAFLVDWIVALLTSAALFGTKVPPADPRENLIITGVFAVEVALLTGLLGFSIGKWVLGIAVINPAGRPIGLPKAVVRTVLLCLVIPVLIQSEHQRGLHDVVAGSLVVRRRGVTPG